MKCVCMCVSVSVCVFQVPFATSIYGLIGPNGGLGFAIGVYKYQIGSQLIGNTGWIFGLKISNCDTTNLQVWLTPP